MKSLGMQSVVAAFADAYPNAALSLRGIANDELKTFLERPPVASAWIPVSVLFALLSAMRRAASLSVDAFEPIGSRSLERDLGTVARFFVRLSSVQFLLSRSAALWSTYYQDFGKVTHCMPQPSVVEVTYSGMPGASAEFFAFHRGALLSLLRASGHPRVTVASTTHTEDQCVFRFHLG